VLWTTDVCIKKENLCRYSMARINICIQNTDFAGVRIFQVIYVRGVMKWYLGPHIAGCFIQVSVFSRVWINRFHCNVNCFTAPACNMWCSNVSVTDCKEVQQRWGPSHFVPFFLLSFQQCFSLLLAFSCILQSHMGTLFPFLDVVTHWNPNHWRVHENLAQHMLLVNEAHMQYWNNYSCVCVLRCLYGNRHLRWLWQITS